MAANNASPDRHQRSIFGRSTILLALLLGGIVGHFHGRYWGQSETSTVLTQFAWTNAATTVDNSPVAGSLPTVVDTTRHAPKEGWRTIQVFSVDTNTHLKVANKKPKAWYAQARQDEIVHSLFRHKPMGYFIDLAANDALSFSNTLALEVNANWTGLCIEPNPLYWHSLAYYRKCQVVAAVVGQNRMDTVDFTYRGTYGGIVDRTFDNTESGGESKIQFTVPLAEVFEYHKVPKVIDYLSLDVEGAEEFVLRHFPFSSYKFSVLTVERPKGALLTLLNETGYVQLKELSKWGETLWAHNSVVSKLDLGVFDSVPTWTI